MLTYLSLDQEKRRNCRAGGLSLEAVTGTAIGYAQKLSISRWDEADRLVEYNRLQPDHLLSTRRRNCALCVQSTRRDALKACSYGLLGRVRVYIIPGLAVTRRRFSRGGNIVKQSSREVLENSLSSVVTKLLSEYDLMIRKPALRDCFENRLAMGSA